MMTLTISENELFDEVNKIFIPVKSQQIQLEHSLVAISKWESKWGKPFISNQDKTVVESLDYIRCMTITPHVDPAAYNSINQKQMEEVRKYIDSTMTATKVYEQRKTGASKEPITAELIYYWMIALNIPFECQKWHLNKLLALIKLCEIKNNPPKKMSKRELLSRNASINAARKAKLGTSG